MFSFKLSWPSLEARKPRSPARRFFVRAAGRLALAAALIVPLAFAAPAQARESVFTQPPVEIGPTTAGNYLAALVAGSQRDTRAAAVFFREALRADPSNLVLVERAFVASLSNGDMQQAFALAERLVRRDSKNGLAQLALGVRALGAGNYSAARRHFGRGGDARSGDITGILLTAWAWAGNGDFKRALATADKLGDKSFAIFRDYHAGLIAAVGGRSREGARRLRAAYDSANGTLRIVDALARLESRRGRRTEALKIYRAFDESLPRHPIVTNAIGRLEAGERLAPMVANAAEGAAEVLYGLGAAGVRQGDELAAIVYLRLALHLAPDHGLAIISLGDLYEQIKQGERALEVYDSMPAKSPLRVSAELQISSVLESLERKDEAQEHLERLMKRAPDDPEVVLALANLQRSRKLFAQAAETYTQALGLLERTGRADWTTYYFRGISYERSKRWPLAEADFKKALELYPDQPLVLNYLGYSWVDKGVNLEKAFKMLRRAVDLRPEDGYIVDSLGWAYYKLGRYEDAVRELERAIELKPADPVINDHLGDAYWKVGRKLEARFQWNHARDLNPEPEELPKILRKIEFGLEQNGPRPAAEAVPASTGG